jgi:hypothetical protein
VPYASSYHPDTLIKVQDLFKHNDAFTAPRFMGNGAPPAARRMRILPMNQPDNVCNEVVNSSQITGGVEYD